MANELNSKEYIFNTLGGNFGILLMQYALVLAFIIFGITLIINPKKIIQNKSAFRISITIVLSLVLVNILIKILKIKGYIA